MNRTNQFLLIVLIILIGVFAYTRIPANQKQAAEKIAQPIVVEGEEGYNFIVNLLNGVTPTPIPTLPPTPFATPTFVTLPPELITAFDQQTSQFDVIFTSRKGSLVTDPNMPSYDMPQGSAYEIPVDPPPAETEFCATNYGEWKKYPLAYVWCPAIVEAFETQGLSTLPANGVVGNTLTVDKILAQSVQESSGLPHVVSYAGAAGYGQVMPSNGFIDLNYVNSCDESGQNCSGGKKDPPDTPEARQAYIDFYTVCANGVDKYTNTRFGNECLNPFFQFRNRPTVEELFSVRGNIAWQVNHMNELTTASSFINALLTYYQGNADSSAPEYTNPICTMLSENSDEACY